MSYLMSEWVSPLYISEWAYEWTYLAEWACEFWVSQLMSEHIIEWAYELMIEWAYEQAYEYAYEWKLMRDFSYGV